MTETMFQFHIYYADDEHNGIVHNSTQIYTNTRTEHDTNTRKEQYIHTYIHNRIEPNSTLQNSLQTQKTVHVYIMMLLCVVAYS